MSTNPLSLGIKAVGVGKKGAREITPELWAAILTEISAEFPHQEGIHIQVAAFLGVFLVFDFEETSCQPLVHSLKILYHKMDLAPDLRIAETAKTSNLKAVRMALENFFFETLLQYLDVNLCQTLQKLMLNQKLSNAETELLAKLLLTTDAQNFLVKTSPVFDPEKLLDTARGLSAAIIRFRYASLEEYQIFYLQLLQQTPQWLQHKSPKANHSLAIVAEPFDGMNKNFFVTPLIARLLRQKGIASLLLCGPSSGPKFDMNLQDIARSMNDNFIRTENDLQNFWENPASIAYCNVFDFCPVLPIWQRIRRYTLKRPFLATIEKFFQFQAAEYLITSAFHDNFSSIMMDLAERIGYRKIIIIRKGREGSLTFSTSKTVEMHLSKKEKLGYVRTSIEFSAEYVLGQFQEDGRFDVGASLNAELIQKYITGEKNPDETLQQNFNHHVQVTLAGIENALAWLDT